MENVVKNLRSVVLYVHTRAVNRAYGTRIAITRLWEPRVHCDITVKQEMAHAQTDR